MKFSVITDRSKVREICIRYEWCDLMDCETYEAMLSKWYKKTFNILDRNDMVTYSNLAWETAKTILYHSSNNGIWTVRDIYRVLMNEATRHEVE